MLNEANLRAIRIGLIAMVALCIVAYLMTFEGQTISAQESGTGTTATTTATTTRSSATTTGNLVVVPGVVQVGQTTLAVGLHVDPFDLEVAIEYSGHFTPDGESCDDAGTAGSTPRAVAPTWIILNACTVGDGWVRLVESGTGNVIEEVNATVTNSSAVGRQADPSVTVSGVTSSELVPRGSGDSFSVAVRGIESGPEYDLTTVALNGSSAAFNRACSIFTEAEEITRAVTRNYTVYGCIPPGTTIWSYLDLNGISLASSDFPGPSVNVKPPTVSFSSSSYSVDEGSNVTITIELSYESHARIRIPITVSNGSAESSDYTVEDLPRGRLTFSSRDTSESFTIEANQDTDDNDETVNLGFGSLPSNVSGTGSQSRATLTIDDDDDDDSPPTPPTLPTPPAPEDLEATASGTTSIDLSWDSVSGVARHRVERGSSSTGPWTTVSSSVSRERYEVTGLSPNTRYYFRVRAYGDGSTYAAEWSDPSDTDSARTDAIVIVLEKPTAPANFIANVGGGAWVYLYWDSQDGIDRYQIDSRPPGGQWEENVYTGPGLPSGDDLRANLRRYPCDSSRQVAVEFKIRAYGDGTTFGAMWGPYSNASVDMECPPTPSGFTATMTYSTKVDLGWDSGSGLENYRVLYRASGTSGWTWASGEIPPTSTSYTVTGLNCGTSYRLAVGALGDSSTYARRWSQSAILSATTDDCDETPSLPSVSNRSGTVGTPLSVQLPAATGGNPPLAYSASPLPSGLSFNTSTRLISGTPTTAQTVTVTYEVTDDDDDTDSSNFTFTITRPPNPTVTIEAEQDSVTEGEDIEFSVTANPAPSSDLSVTVSVAQTGTFIAGTGTTSVTILANDREASFTVNTVDDNVDEPDGRITAEVEDGTGYDLGRPSSDTVDVRDNDPTPTVSFSSSSYSVTEGSDRRIYVDLSHGSSRRLIIPITVSSGTAEDEDYEVDDLPNSRLTFNSEDESEWFTIEAIDDDKCNEDDAVALRLGTLPSGVLAGAPRTATVTIIDIDICINGPQGPRHAEGSTDDVANYTADPPDVTWSLAGDDASFFAIGSNGKLSFIDAPDFDNPQDDGNNNVYDVTIRTTKTGFTDGTLAVTVRVTNEPPMITSGPDLVTFREGGTGSVGTYSASDPGGGRITWSLPNTTFETDRGDFDISSGGLLTFDDITPDYEDPDDHNDDNVYRITVTASDASNRLDTINVTITVRNVDEMGTVNLSTTTPQVSANITAVLTDEDGNVRNESWHWQSSPNGVSWPNISGATGYSYRPVRGDAGNRLRARVTYDDGHGTGKTATTGATSAVTQSNNPPTFDEGATATREVAENTEGGEPIGLPFSASDSDSGDTLIYTLGGTNANSFEIVDTSGQLQTKTGVTYDHETKASYSVTVSVSDGNAGSDSIDVIINVTNVNEAPVARHQIGNRTLDDDTPSLRIDLSSYFDDPDTNDVLKYQATSSPLNVVSLTGSGSHLTMARVSSGSTTVTVTATDSGGLYVRQRYAVSVIIFPTLTPPVLRVDGAGETILTDFTLPDSNFNYVVSLMWLVCDGSPDCGGTVIYGNADKNPLNSGTLTFGKSLRPQPEKPPYRVGLKACTTASRDVCGSYQRSNDSVGQLNPPVIADVVPLPLRKALLTWRPSLNGDNNTEYDVHATYPGGTWTPVKNDASVADGHEIVLDSVVRTDGLDDHTEFEFYVIARDGNTPKLKLNSEASNEIKIIDNPILTGGRANGNSSAGNGKAELEWDRVPSVQEYTVRYRKLGDRPRLNPRGQDFDHSNELWPGHSDWPYYGPFLVPVSVPQTSSMTVSETIGGLDLGEIHAFQINYETTSGEKVFSARDAYVWPSDTVPTRISRVGTYPFFGYWEGGNYGYTICSDTFAPPNTRGDWENLIFHAFKQWEQAASDVITVTRQYEDCLSDDGSPIDNNVPLSVIRALYNESNEVYMVDTAGWPPVLGELWVSAHNKLFFCIEFAPACVISPRYLDLTWLANPLRPSIRALDDGSVDILVNVSVAPPGRDLDIPGSNTSVSLRDTRFNVCYEATTDDDDFDNYELMVHEVGHALGLSNFDYLEFFSSSVAHPSIPDAVMNYDWKSPRNIDSSGLWIRDEPDCSPHPFDIMAIEALYQNIIP